MSLHKVNYHKEKRGGVRREVEIGRGEDRERNEPYEPLKPTFQFLSFITSKSRAEKTRKKFEKSSHAVPPTKP